MCPEMMFQKRTWFDPNAISNNLCDLVGAV